MKLTKDKFLDDVKDHQIKILLDNGIYRHIRCENPKTTNQWFEIVTWIGHLAYTGDMGSYMFTRVKDMFWFFRDSELKINPGYWSEKCISESIFGHGIREFSIEKFKKNVIEDAKMYLNIENNKPLPKEIIEEIKPLLNCEDEYECIETMRNFYSDKIEFHDFWECTNEELTYYFLWCCYAIVWTIQQYDKEKHK